MRPDLRTNVPLAEYTWLKVGGSADFYAEIRSLDELSYAMREFPKPICIIGAGSNVLIRDAGFRGTILRFEREMDQLEICEDSIIVSASCLNLKLVAKCIRLGIAGLEFLCGIPGTVGGALFMNAGVKDVSMQDVVLGVDVMDMEGNVHRLDVSDVGYQYRSSAIPEGWIFTSARLRVLQDDPTRVASRVRELLAKRAKAQPISGRISGCFFKNPLGMSAWKLIRDSGSSDLTVGSACVSKKHANFLCGARGVMAKDIEDLAQSVIKQVYDYSGITLAWEVRRIGESI